MNVQPNQTLKDLQDRFANQFLGLKIEFYAKPHKHHEGSDIKEQLDSSTRISDVSDNKTDQSIHLDYQMTTRDVEALFESRLGLYAQVFRRSGDIWLQTSKTDDWTLEKQCRKAMRSIEEASNMNK